MDDKPTYLTADAVRKRQIVSPPTPDEIATYEQVIISAADRGARSVTVICIRAGLWSNDQKTYMDALLRHFAAQGFSVQEQASVRDLRDHSESGPSLVVSW